MMIYYERLFFGSKISVFLIVSIILLTSPVKAQEELCKSATNCGQCTQIPQCVWCRQEDYLGSRCFPRSTQQQGDLQCSQRFIVDSQIKFNLIGQNRKVTIGRGVTNPVQLYPQRVSLTNMRVGQVYNITLQFRPTEDYPVDLYFLMDLSNSMSDDRDNLVKLSEELASTMKSITIHYQLGFGSFIDKDVFPFVNRVCPVPNVGRPTNECKPPYSFRNVLPLTQNIAAFTRGVNSGEIIGNHDEPEGAFEALLQAIVCKQQIGWRNESRHIIVLATDDYPHIAGDGRYGGIIKPNDGKCHLDNRGQYTEGLTQDHPSLGQLSRLARENSINVIFAVTANKVKPYEKFAEMVSEFTAGQLEGDSSNIVRLVEKQYEAIRSTVELRDNANSIANSSVRIRYFTSCLEPLNANMPPRVRENNTCDGLQVGTEAKTVSFNISVEITHCPAEGERKRTITVSPAGLSETLTIELEMVCDCPCELADNVTCPSLCQDFEFCVLCDKFPVDEKPTECNNCTEFKITSEDGPIDVMRTSERKCVSTDNSTDCRTDFVYGYDFFGQRQVRYAKVPTCPPLPPPIQTANIAFGLMGALIAVGLGLLLLWRLLLFLYDRKEYARFLNDSKNAKWNAANNPLYVEASTTFKNPAFNRRSNATST